MRVVYWKRPSNAQRETKPAEDKRLNAGAPKMLIVCAEMKMMKIVRMFMDSNDSFDIIVFFIFKVLSNARKTVKKRDRYIDSYNHLIFFK